MSARASVLSEVLIQQMLIQQVPIQVKAERNLKEVGSV